MSDPIAKLKALAASVAASHCADSCNHSGCDIYRELGEELESLIPEIEAMKETFMELGATAATNSLVVTLSEAERARLLEPMGRLLKELRSERRDNDSEVAMEIEAEKDRIAERLEAAIRSAKERA